MKTKTCKYCKEEIAKNAKKCPKCGGNLGIPGFVKVIIIVVVILGCIVGCVNSCSKAVNDAVDETTNSYKDINGKTSFKLNETFENKYEKITMTEVDLDCKDYDEYFAPKDGNKVILVKFEVENIGENDEIYVSNASFTGYADDSAVEQYWYLADKYKDLSTDLAKGKKVSGYIAYEAPSNLEKFTIDYNADFWIDGNSIQFVVK